MNNEAMNKMCREFIEDAQIDGATTEDLAKMAGYMLTLIADCTGDFDMSINGRRVSVDTVEETTND